MSDPLTDTWYAITLAGAVHGSPIRRWIFGQPIVMFRAGGQVDDRKASEIVALADICPHRNAPLSLGKVVDGNIQCKYHGLQFNAAGTCVLVPGQRTPPPATLSVRSYPIVEKYGIVWIWPGAPERADPSRIVEWPYFSDPAFRSLHAELVIDAPVEMAIDNLMDLTHVHFVHKFGANIPVHASPLKVWSKDEQVHYSREVAGARFVSDMGQSDSSTFMEIGGSFHAPSYISTFAFTKSVTTKEVIPGPHRIIIHGLTPESDNRIRYVYLRSWNLYHSPAQIEAALNEDIEALEEDKSILEATYELKHAFGSRLLERLIKSDEAAVYARRIYESIKKNSRTDIR